MSYGCSPKITATEFQVTIVANGWLITPVRRNDGRGGYYSNNEMFVFNEDNALYTFLSDRRKDAEGPA